LRFGFKGVTDSTTLTPEVACGNYGSGSSISSLAEVPNAVRPHHARNLASIMPQVLGAWCESEGHEVTSSSTPASKTSPRTPADLDLVFISAFSQSAQVAYALSNMFRKRGAVTVLGGPHARCYPEDSQKYFDYVLGFTDRTSCATVLDEARRTRRSAAARRADAAARAAERARALEVHRRRRSQKAPTIKIVPMLASLGCPYTCPFCIDSTVAYQPLEFDR
jgi:radical SAM superfamily enzyme YgiQ (UPF0313 family)